MNADRIVYSLTCNAHPGCVALIYYDLLKSLVRVDFNPDASKRFKTIFGTELPVTPERLDSFKAVGCQVKDVSNIDLSFKRFWDVYANKVGNIKRCKKLWEQLPDEDKIMALGFIRRLRNLYQQKGLQMPYPETYLNQRRWENIID